MNGSQKFAVVVGLIALGVSSFVAPFRYVEDNVLTRLINQEARSGTLYRPIFAPPKIRESTQTFAGGSVRPDAVELNTGALAMTWAGIALVTLAWVALASGSKPQTEKTPTPSILG